MLIAVISVFCYTTHLRTRHALVVADALELIHQEYIDPVDERKLLLSALSGMTGGLDPYSEFIPLEQYEKLQNDMSGEFAGIGIYVDRPDENQPVKVVTPLVGSPALEAGLQSNDQFIMIDGEDVSAMDLTEVSRRLKGPIGTSVDLVVRRGENEVSLVVSRGNIRMESVVGYQRREDQSWIFRLEDEPTIAYARLTTFGEKTPEELRKVLADLDETTTGFILDLRANGGGLLDTAVQICDLFIAGGVVVSTEIRGGIIEYRYRVENEVAVKPDLPIVVLIDHNSASASEIVAAAMQDRGRAKIVGTRSFGKGTVQNVLPLEVGRSALKLTVARYLRPNGKNIHRTEEATPEQVWGVSPSKSNIVEMNEQQQSELFLSWRERAFPYAAKLDIEGLEISNLEDSPSMDPVTSDSDSDVLIPSNPVANDSVPIELKLGDGNGESEFDSLDSSSDAGSRKRDGGGSMSDGVDPQLRRAVEVLTLPLKSTVRVAA